MAFEFCHCGSDFGHLICFIQSLWTRWSCYDFRTAKGFVHTQALTSGETFSFEIPNDFWPLWDNEWTTDEINLLSSLIVSWIQTKSWHFRFINKIREYPNRMRMDWSRLYLHLTPFELIVSRNTITKLAINWRVRSVNHGKKIKRCKNVLQITVNTSSQLSISPDLFLWRYEWIVQFPKIETTVLKNFKRWESSCQTWPDDDPVKQILDAAESIHLNFILLFCGWIHNDALINVIQQQSYTQH